MFLGWKKICQKKKTLKKRQTTGPLECYDCNSMCLDNAPDRNGCAAQAGWGKCGVSRLFSFSFFFFRERGGGKVKEF